MPSELPPPFPALMEREGKTRKRGSDEGEGDLFVMDGGGGAVLIRGQILFRSLMSLHWPFSYFPLLLLSHIAHKFDSILLLSDRPPGAIPGGEGPEGREPFYEGEGG